MGFAGNGTLFYVRIENNNKPNYYCYNIYKVSQYQNEKEILITSNCTFHITNIINSLKKDGVDEIYLTCEGFKNNWWKDIHLINDFLNNWVWIFN